jgi:lysophospholipase L1-like esterase
MPPLRPLAPTRRGIGPSGRGHAVPRRTRAVISAVLAAGFVLAAGPTVAGAVSPTASFTPSDSYVALGDSYTAGPGLPPAAVTGSGAPAPTACQRSSGNYPTLVAKDLGLTLRDASCLGASTKDLAQSQGPGIPPQLSALSPSTALVSLGIGGNDLGFSSIVTNCAAATPWGATKVGWHCGAHYSVDGVNDLVATVHQVGQRVTAALADIRARAPVARVFVVGYPDIVPASGSGCWPKVPFSSADLSFVRGIEDDLNATLDQAATAAGDQFVNMAGASAAHSACTPVATRWVEPLVPLHGGFPLHPSADGMAGMAQVLEGAVTST